MNSYTIKYIIGGYGSLGRVITDCGYAKTANEYLSRFWQKYNDILDCVKPVIVELKENNIKIQLTKEEMRGF